MLAHNAVMVGLAVDPHRLFYAGDREYIVWLSTVIERIHNTQREAAAKGG